MNFVKSSPNKWFMRKVSAMNTLQGPTQKVFGLTGPNMHTNHKNIEPAQDGEFSVGTSVVGGDDVIVHKRGRSKRGN
jgi:hypothetical protein